MAVTNEQVGAMNVTNSRGLVAAFSATGALRTVEVDPIRISMAPAADGTRAGANLYLRLRGPSIAFTPLLGPHGPSSFRIAAGGYEARGTWAGLDYVCALRLASSRLAWQWSVQVTSTRADAVELDLVCVQDVGLKTAAPGPVNAYYVSQYLERRVFDDPRFGSVVCCRQNMREQTGHPWLMLACAQRAVAASTDGHELYGASFRATGEPEALRADRLGGELAGEASLAALQAEPFVLAPGAVAERAFVALYLPDHPEASSARDLAQLPALVRELASVTSTPLELGPLTAPAHQPLEHAPWLQAEDLTPDELTQLFGGARRHAEQEDGKLLSFFLDGPRHVVLRAKELRVDRPHGHIMQAQIGLVPNEHIVSTTAFACGVFNSHITQGNTNFGSFLSTCTTPATPTLDAGQRILVQLDGRPHLLGVPSASELGLSHCRWIYKRGQTLLEVTTWTSPDAPRVNLALKVLGGGPLALTIVHGLDALNGWAVSPGAAAHELIARPRADSPLGERFPRAQFRLIVNTADGGYASEPTPSGSGRFVLEVAPTTRLCLSIVGELDGPSGLGPITEPDQAREADEERAARASCTLSRGMTLRGSAAISPIGEILPWYAANALVHYLTPYGLEQFSGAAWGTRDVCQGPIDLLLCQEQYEAAKEVLRVVFRHQDEAGGWPQWWMFDSFRAVRADSAHGDVVYWCILALCSYIEASGDFAFLDEPLPYFSADGSARVTTALSEHVDRVIALVVGSFVPGTALVQFGGGDWNDSLQPVSKELARRLISSWTVQMCYQAFDAYREVCERAGKHDRAGELAAISARILADFNRHLVRDGIVAGYGLVGEQGGIDVLLHPSDETTGVRYSLLPMNRGVISGMFTREQAVHHGALIERHLSGPDGARLMDRPLRYQGGLQTIFQRAESSTYFGREIGLMYVHEHLRYAERLARMGEPAALLRALRQAIPVAYREVVPQGEPRQANCYYSSSDVLFRSRYEADARYGEVVAGALPLRGGWRVYSSGPGIYVAMVTSRLLGLRISFGNLILDPVLDRSLDGLEASLVLRGRPVTLCYRVKGPGFGPRALSVNGSAVQFEREANPYREGGAVVSLAHFISLLGAEANRVDVTV